MVNFEKLTAALAEKRKTPQYDYEYRCSTCGEDVVYVTKMPASLLKHSPLGGRCGGRLVVRRALPRPLTQEQMDNLEEGRAIVVRFKARGPGAYACEAHIADDGRRYVLLADERVYLVAEDITKATVLPRKVPGKANKQQHRADAACDCMDCAINGKSTR